MEGKLKAFSWVVLFLMYFVSYAIIIGIACAFVNYFFVDIFTLKNYAGIVIAVTFYYLIKEQNKYEIMIDNKIKKAMGKKEER